VNGGGFRKARRARSLERGGVGGEGVGGAGAFGG
jgi:hypothetical protein